MWFVCFQKIICISSYFYILLFDNRFKGSHIVMYSKYGIAYKSREILNRIEHFPLFEVRTNIWVNTYYFYYAIKYWWKILRWKRWTLNETSNLYAIGEWYVLYSWVNSLHHRWNKKHYYCSLLYSSYSFFEIWKNIET